MNNAVFTGVVALLYILGTMCIHASALPEDSWPYKVYAPGIWAIDEIAGDER